MATPDSDLKEHDILSLLSIFTRAYTWVTAGYNLIGVVIDNQHFDLPAPVHEGGYSEIYVLSSKDLLDACVLRESDVVPGNPLPEVVAVKCPKMKGQSSDKRNKKLWTSMATELQILHHERLRDHENLIKLLGMCWRSSGNNIMPALVLETAYMDLRGLFTSQGMTISKLSTRKVLGLSIDICSGLSALHEVGIIHGDLKPENVLIFKDKDLGHVAKLTDFGSSLFQKKVEHAIVLPFGTDLWQAPECKEALDGHQLLQADVFALGLVLAFLISRGYFGRLWEELNKETRLLESIDIYYLTGSCVRESMRQVMQKALEAEEAEIYGPLPSRAFKEPNEERESTDDNESDDDEADDSFDENEQCKPIRKIRLAIEETLLSAVASPTIRRKSKTVHRNLRICLSWILRRDIFYPFKLLDPFAEGLTKHATTQNAQEKDILQNPANEAPSEEERERIWSDARRREWLKKSFEAIRAGMSVPGIDDISRDEAAHQIERTLKNWNRLELPNAESIEELCKPGTVVEADRAFGTLSTLPTSVIDYIMTEMRNVAHDRSETDSRRAEAAWQFSLFQLRVLQVSVDSSTDIDLILELMLTAAKLGHIEAGGIVGTIHSAFDRPLPITLEVEVEWLRKAICKGGSTARRRLALLDQSAYVTAIAELGIRYAGVGVEVPGQYWNDDECSDNDFLSHLKWNSSKAGDIFQIAATSGRTRLLEQIWNIYSDTLDINALYEGKESALLKSCRSGHVDCTVFLLDHGASASTPNVDGATPLHFLSSFDDESIPMITDRLVAAGADVNARSSNANVYKHAVDAVYGEVNGTPLTWAVAFDNEMATQALIDVGADPFDLLGREVEYENGWSNNSHVSPVWYAAVNCQSRLLFILLRNAKNCGEHLNFANRTFGTMGHKDPFSVLGWVVNSRSFQYRRILLHESTHQEAFAETFNCLVSYGADPFNVDRNGISALRLAIQWAQPFIIDFLVGWREGCLTLKPKEWLHDILVTCSLSDYISFKTLLRYSQAEQLTSEQWNMFFATTHGLPDDVKFLEHFVSYRDLNRDMHAEFGNALMSGKYELAKWLYRTGKCDLTQAPDGKTILGRLIISSKTHRSSSRHLEVLLDLQPPDEVFYNVINMVDSQFSALQAAMYIQEYRKGYSVANPILQSILRRKYDPDYINLRISDGHFAGKTAMHLAVETCNEEAIDYLLEEEGDELDLSILDREGNSLIDQAAFQLKNQESNMDFWEVPEHQRLAMDLKHFQRTISIIIKLYKTKRAKPKKIWTSVTRVEPDELMVLFYMPDQLGKMNMKLSTLRQLMEEEQSKNRTLPTVASHGQMAYLWDSLKNHGLKLKLNSSFFELNSNAMSAEEIERFRAEGYVETVDEGTVVNSGEPKELAESLSNLRVNTSGSE